MPPPLYASTTLPGKRWSRWSAELLGRWSSWVSSTVRAFGHRWSTAVLVLRRCIETTGIGACTRAASPDALQIVVSLGLLVGHNQRTTLIVYTRDNPKREKCAKPGFKFFGGVKRMKAQLMAVGPLL